jgi:nascent polypeptide-associated complex subunit alpha
MMPNIDPRTMRNMMAKMGIKSSEINAEKVSIECPTKVIIIDNPQVTLIEAQGVKSFQITGEISEKERSVVIEISEEDVKLVMEKSGAGEDESRKALAEANGDIAAAILSLAGKEGQ